MIRKQGPPQASPVAPGTSRKSDPPARPRRVGPARQAKSSTPHSQDAEGDSVATHKKAFHKGQTINRTVGVDWMARSVCGGQDLNLFFGPDGERQPDREVREWYAKEVCSICPVRTDCLDYAITSGQKTGVWGGLTEDERASETRWRARRRAA